MKGVYWIARGFMVRSYVLLPVVMIGGKLAPPWPPFPLPLILPLPLLLPLVFLDESLV